VIVDTGDCMFAAVDIRSNEIVGPAFYATMGFAVPAALGVQIASGQRPIVLVGDGAFQMTGPEISHAPLYGCNPVIVVFNNTRWEMLQAFFPDARYNTTVAWPFAPLANLWGGRGFIARTPRELRDALSASWEEGRFSVIDVTLQPGDISPILRGFVRAFKTRLETAEGGAPAHISGPK
jgi:indolepyruvate decarboxylase